MTTLTTTKKVLGLSTSDWILIPIGVVISIIAGFIVYILKIPLFMDAIGIILVAVIAGPWAGAIAGLLVPIIQALIYDPTAVPYAFVGLCIGLAAGFLAKVGMYTTWWKTLISGVVIALVATITSTPITVFFFGGVTGSGSDLIRAGLLASGQQIWQAVFSTAIFTELIDKGLSSLIAFLIIKGLPKRFTDRFGIARA
jgi:energy-coupling factor transport system substrate-specific component